MSDSYHLEELRIARDPSHPSHQLPPPVKAGAVVLDIGCGAGQTLIASYPDRRSFGLDVDAAALQLGRTLTDRVAFTCGKAEALPYRDAQFDLVVARVSLAYTNIPRSLSEIHRVLRPGGTVWMTLHPLSLCWRQALRANWKGWLFFGYVVTNGLCLHLFQKQFSLSGKHESFQTESGIRRALHNAGFRTIEIDRSKRFVVIAR